MLRGVHQPTRGLGERCKLRQQPAENGLCISGSHLEHLFPVFLSDGAPPPNVAGPGSRQDQKLPTGICGHAAAEVSMALNLA